MADGNIDNHKVKLTPDGLLNINSNLKIHPLKLMEIPATSQQAIFELTEKFANKTLTRTEFHEKMKAYCKMHVIAFESMRKETLEKLCQMYGKEHVTDIVVAGEKIFANATPHDIDRLRVVLENTLRYDERILDMATEFAECRGCTTAEDFIICVEYFVADLNETVKSYEESYQKDLAAAKKQPGFSQLKFDAARGIIKGMKRVQFHRAKALAQFNSESYDELNERFESLKSKVAPLNQKCEPGFFSDDAATYHYFKHRHFGSIGELTPEQYFQVAEDVFGNPTNKYNSVLSQDGSCVIITYLEPQRGVRAVKIDRQLQSGIATVMYDDKVLKRD